MNEVHTFFNQLLDLPFKKSLLSSLYHKQLKDEHALHGIRWNCRVWFKKAKETLTIEVKAY